MSIPRIPDWIRTSEQMRAELRRLRRTELLLSWGLALEIMLAVLILTSVVFDPTGSRLLLAFKIFIPFSLSMLMVGTVLKYREKFAVIAAELRKRLGDGR
jgi:hypothetical protein